MPHKLLQLQQPRLQAGWLLASLTKQFKPLKRFIIATTAARANAIYILLTSCHVSSYSILYAIIYKLYSNCICFMLYTMLSYTPYAWYYML